MITDGVDRSVGRPSGNRPAEDRPTRDRLLDAGMALIAQRGFKAVTVGEIEAAVGLAPRRGGLYKHFPSKQALVEAAIEDRIARVAGLSALVDWFGSDEARSDHRASLILMARAILDELDREKHISQIIEKEGDRFPELRDRMRTAMVDPGFRYTETAFESWVTGDGRNGSTIDIPAVAAIMLSALVHHRRQEWLLGLPPHNIDTDRYLEAWADTTLRVLNLSEDGS